MWGLDIHLDVLVRVLLDVLLVQRFRCWLQGFEFRVRFGDNVCGFRLIRGWCLWFGTWGLGFRVQGLGFRVWGLGVRIWVSGLRVEG